MGKKGFGFCNTNFLNINFHPIIFQNKPVKVQHVWVMCRDMEEYNPATAWKLLELHMQEASLAI